MLLAIDTSGPLCSAAILGNDGFAALRSEEIGRGHAELLMPMLEDLVQQAGIGWNELDHIACTTGPGSFTGLRVGLAAARGLALGLDCPCIGVTVFEGFSFGDNEPLAVMLDAKRNQIWLQVFGTETSEPLAVDQADAMNRLPAEVTRLTGSAATMITEKDSRFSVVSTSASPPIERVALCAHAAIRTGGSAAAHPPRPLYLRQPDAKPQNPTAMAV